MYDDNDTTSTTSTRALTKNYCLVFYDGMTILVYYRPLLPCLLLATINYYDCISYVLCCIIVLL